jgi:lipopolysaccharide/colanic/teichoic acid biosynthesis glycosyltransferase
MPFMLLIAFLIRLDSKGPVIFAQDRIGLKGRCFRMYKFRTMYHDDSSDDLTPSSLNDPRITRFGRWLRRSSFDELPQLFNVITGPMSLVGPRPEMPFIVEQYNEIQRERLKVKPGITGLWQISADRRLAIHENMDYDLYYVHEQSFLLDVVILIQTFFFAFKGI